MAEEEGSQEKTEQPTEQKLRKLHEQGEIPRSKDLVSASVLTLLVIVGFLLFSELSNPIIALTRYCLQFTFTEATDIHWMFIKMLPSKYIVLKLFFILTILCFISAIVSSISLGGWILSDKPLYPNFSRLNPINGLKRMFSSKSLIELGKAIIKLLVIVGSFTFCLVHYHHNFINLGSEDITTAIYHGLKITAYVIIICCITYLVITLLDIPLQLHIFSKKAMMTHQEIKEGHKAEEGNPEIKRKIRSIQQEISNRKMLSALPSADVIITNPTHFAVALGYTENIHEAPVVIALGADHMAALIITIAKKHKRPVMMHPLLARTLFHNTAIGDTIPIDLYMAVAKVLAYVRQVQDYENGKRENRPEAPIIDVPDHYRNTL